MWGEFTDDVESYMVLVDGCNEQAEVELGRPEPGLRDALSASIEEAWRPFEGALEDIEQDIETDDRLEAAWVDWSTCLAKKGYSFNSEEEIESYLMAELGGLGESVTEGTLIVDEAMERDLQPLADEEIAIATADHGCSCLLYTSPSPRDL